MNNKIMNYFSSVEKRVIEKCIIWFRFCKKYWKKNDHKHFLSYFNYYNTSNCNCYRFRYFSTQLKCWLKVGFTKNQLLLLPIFTLWSFICSTYYLLMQKSLPLHFSASYSYCRLPSSNHCYYFQNYDCFHWQSSVPEFVSSTSVQVSTKKWLLWLSNLALPNIAPPRKSTLLLDWQTPKKVNKWIYYTKENKINKILWLLTGCQEVSISPDPSFTLWLISNIFSPIWLLCLSGVILDNPEVLNPHLTNVPNLARRW